MLRSTQQRVIFLSFLVLFSFSRYEQNGKTNQPPFFVWRGEPEMFWGEQNHLFDLLPRNEEQEEKSRERNRETVPARVFVLDDLTSSQTLSTRLSENSTYYWDSLNPRSFQTFHFVFLKASSSSVPGSYRYGELENHHLTSHEGEWNEGRKRKKIKWKFGETPKFSAGKFASRKHRENGRNQISGILAHLTRMITVA